MTQRLVMLDANLIIAAYDIDARLGASELEGQEIIKNAKDIVNKLLADTAVRFVTTPLIRYEVLCGVKSKQSFEYIQILLNQFKLFEIRKEDADYAVEEYKLSCEITKGSEPKPSKFDLFHVASAINNGFKLESCDNKGVIKRFKEQQNQKI
jgi:predicted nucleic acid-binding protein